MVEPSGVEGARAMVGLNSPASTQAILALTAGLAIKHYAADFLLQNNWMARGKERLRGWEAPLAAHAGVHGLATLAIVLLLRPGLWWLGPADFAVHGLIDRGKAVAGHRLAYPVSDARFWWLMGFDQLLHHLTNIALVAVIALL